jgi:uncharacterized protein YbjT (DUF2867 family)
MPAQQRTAWIAGASGLVGGHCLRILLDRWDCVVSIGRRPSGVQHPKLIERQTPFEKLADLDAPAPGAVFSALGTTIKVAGSQEAFVRVDHDYVVMLGEEGLRRGATDFLVVSSVDAEEWCPLFYLKVKARMEFDVRALDYPAVHVFRPSFLYGKRTESRPGEAMGIAAAKLLSPLFLGGFSRYRGVEAADVAAAMVAAAEKGEAGRHRYHWREIMTLARAVRKP